MLRQNCELFFRKGCHDVPTKGSYRSCCLPGLPDWEQYEFAEAAEIVLIFGEISHGLGRVMGTKLADGHSDGYIQTLQLRG